MINDFSISLLFILKQKRSLLRSTDKHTQKTNILFLFRLFDTHPAYSQKQAKSDTRQILLGYFSYFFFSFSKKQQKMNMI